MFGHRNSKNAQICLFCQNSSVSAEVLLEWGSFRVYNKISMCEEKCTPDQRISEYPFKYHNMNVTNQNQSLVKNELALKKVICCVVLLGDGII